MLPVFAAATSPFAGARAAERQPGGEPARAGVIDGNHPGTEGRLVRFASASARSIAHDAAASPIAAVTVTREP